MSGIHAPYRNGGNTSIPSLTGYRSKATIYGMIDPYTIKTFIPETTWDKIEATEDYKLAHHIAQHILDSYPYIAERPRWAAWYDQVQRSSMSTLQNLCESFGRAQGYYRSSLMIARGEAYETAASISIGPKEICQELKQPILDLLKLLSKRILDAPEKKDIPFYR